LTDCIKQLYPEFNKEEFTHNRIRIWLVDDYEKLNDSFKEIAQKSGQAASEDVDMRDDSQTETNSGVECPGMSLEPCVGTSLTLEEKEFHSQKIMVEISNPDFAFSYKK
jgi:hypothetical protein